MTGVGRRLTAAAVLLVLGSCGASDPSNRLAVWTRALSDAQTDGPQLLVFQRNGRRLVFVAVEHEANPRSPTHRLITSAFALSPRIVIVEGLPTSRGYDPPDLAEIAGEQPQANGLLANGETVPAVSGALQSGASLLGGEPEDEQVRVITATLGVSDEDLLGFYVLRVVPQWLVQRQITDLANENATELINQQLARSRSELGLSADVLPDADSWRLWRLAKNRRADPHRLDVEEAGPLSDGPWPTSRIGAAISRARDTHLYRLIEAQLRRARSVMVVFGGSHALIQLPALQMLLGPPCYRGSEPVDALKTCRVDQ